MCVERIVVVAVSVTLLLSGCSAGWQKLEPVAPMDLNNRQQVQVWTGAQARILHAVRVDTRSLTGVPFARHPDCDSCRVSIPLATVDSVRLGNKEFGFFILLGTIGATTLLLTAVFNSWDPQ